MNREAREKSFAKNREIQEIEISRNSVILSFYSLPVDNSYFNSYPEFPNVERMSVEAHYIKSLFIYTQPDFKVRNQAGIKIN